MAKGNASFELYGSLTINNRNFPYWLTWTKRLDWLPSSLARVRPTNGESNEHTNYAHFFLWMKKDNMSKMILSWKIENI